MYNISDVASSLEIPLHRAEELVGIGVFKAEDDGGFDLTRSRRRWWMFTALDRPTLSDEVERERIVAGVLLKRLDDASMAALPAALREVAEAIRRVTDALEIGVARVPAHARPAAKALADEVAVSFGLDMMAVADAAVRGVLDRERRRLRGECDLDAADLEGGAE